MKIINTITLLILAISSASFAASPYTDSEINARINGKWNCSYEQSESNGFHMSVDSEETFVRNGRSNSMGSMRVKFVQEFPEVTYSIVGSSTWEVQNGYLITTLEDIKFVNLSHPELDKLINLNDMFPKNISDSEEVVELSDTRLLLKSESDGTLYQCQREPEAQKKLDVEFKAGTGLFKIKEIEKLGIYSTYEYSFNGKKLGTNELSGLKVEPLGHSDDADYFALKAGTGGNGCAEIFSIVRATNDYLVFSPTIDACGGIESIKLIDDRDVKRVRAVVYDRDEKTSTRYDIHGSTVLMDGRHDMPNQFSFIQH
ncbi:hypothetical protein [Vibrio diazotrophicus]|uniref:hypothetical protein n=1 Tax=Vibrio diazotrophicus TaxID=685 RepID=UPI000C9EAEF8|nr:hypothetical protein [Vibrio diazotrophicus]PNH81247.1 hypothetical protein C1N27_06795 [Vibrio diazotrophicus]